ncbi:MAG: NFACT RNA binding domain-containing protein [Candidatus Diapherotrites archaeon]|nr:NFACT RNA binding domain-containing protein [Candidatus Diapherotrites archaeon]
MDLEIDLDKSVEENASAYFEKSKKAKKKLQGLLRAIEETKAKIAKASAEAEEKKAGCVPLPKKAKPQWFNQFYWFKSSDGLLVVGGKSAQSNEVLVKKHLQQGDLFLHADIQGASACVIKSDGLQIPASTIGEAAQFAAAHSKAWQQGFAGVDVYAVAPEQVSKTPPSGTSLATGSFMINGKRQWFRKTPLAFAVGLQKEGDGFSVVAGPKSAVEKQAAAFVVVKPGALDKDSAAKKILGVLEKKAGQKAGLSQETVKGALPASGISVADG